MRFQPFPLDRHLAIDLLARSRSAAWAGFAAFLACHSSVTARRSASASPFDTAFGAAAVAGTASAAIRVRASSIESNVFISLGRRHI